MNMRMLALIGAPLLCLGFLVQAADSPPPANVSDSRLLSEQKHFLECLASLYSPSWWLSYHDSLYFQARDQAQAQQLEAMRLARSRYLALTNHETRHALAATVIAESGISRAWQRKLLLPLSTTNQNLTPTLDKPLWIIPAYKVLRSYTNGDALIQDDVSTFFVMNLACGTNPPSGTNALLIREGVKTYAAGDRFKTVDAFANVALSQEETAILDRVAAAFQGRAASLGRQLAASAARHDFEALKPMATDSNPYMQYLLARAYLDGNGTDRDEKLGLEWMRRAARSGSGDALAYLAALKPKTP